MKASAYLPFLVALLLTLAKPSNAQVPDTLKHTLDIAWQRTQSFVHPGHNMAIDGDLLAVGTPSENAGVVSGAGTVRVFSVSTGTLLHVIPNPSPVSQDGFGWSVALSGTRLVIGVPYKDVNAGADGIAYVYELSGPTPTVPARILNYPAGTTGGFFGHSVAISGNRIAVGAPTGAPSATPWLEHGYVHLYDLSAPLPEVSWLSVSGNQTQFSEFGNSVALSGQTLVVGAARQTVASQDAGAVFVYDLNDGTPSLANLVVPNPFPHGGAEFGRCVAVSGSRMVIGCPGYSGNTGRAYVHDLASGSPGNPVLTLEAPNAGFFGSRVAIVGTRIGISAPGDQTLMPSISPAVGRGFVYDIASTTPGTPAAILKPGSAPYTHIENFGFSLAFSGTTIAVAETDSFSPFKCFTFTPGPASLFNHAMSTTGLGGANAQPLATPSGDGNPNLLKYAFNLNLSGPDVRGLIPGTGTAGLPSIARAGNALRVEFLRRTGSGLLYTPWKSADLGNPSGWLPFTTTPSVQNINSQWERVIYEEPFNPATTPALFGTVEVTLP